MTKQEPIRVLVVDDSPLFREALANFVGHLDGMVVVGRASDGQEAVELAIDTVAEVVFMDVVMPRLDGLAATRALKRLRPPPVVIACSTYEDDRLQQRVLEVGADAFVPKRDLAAAAEELLRRLTERLVRPRSEGGAP